MKVSISNLFQIILYTGILLVADMVTKSWAVNHLQYEPWSPLSWFELTYSENPGIAFGLSFGGIALLIVSALLIIGFTAYAVLALDLNKLSVKILVSLILGGAIGNFIDRILLGIVRDFIRIGPWPLFNVADTAIVIGLIALTLSLYLPEHGRGKSSNRS
ncbi:MAG: signal peptidase II [Candidatus Peregrinibacteria bacterium]|nr:signal peptidase II [Candidatus Peregrinibacteria bacterium]